uniref:Uncharacterized protein n=1 Tax=Glossina austeni TaxID=7395 RepID=A0A1A9VQG7_GLOAU
MIGGKRVRDVSRSKAGTLVFGSFITAVTSVFSASICCVALLFLLRLVVIGGAGVGTGVTAKVAGNGSDSIPITGCAMRKSKLIRITNISHSKRISCTDGGGNAIPNATIPNNGG